MTDRFDRLPAAIERLANERGDEMRLVRAEYLAADIEALVAWMRRAWDWLDRNKPADPLSPEQSAWASSEDTLIARIHLYTRAVDAVRAVQEVQP